MLYELSVLAKAELGDDQVAKINNMVKEVVGAHKGEVLIQDDWGKKTLAQPTSKGLATGRYLYFMFKTDDNKNNAEVERRLRINEDVAKHMIVKLGEEKDQEAIVKNYKTPFSKQYAGSVTDEEESSDPKDRRRFARRRDCWFTAKGIKADWKDPKTFNWLINEFGKISPARVSGISRKHQRFVTQAIRRARNMSVVSHISNKFAE